MKRFVTIGECMVELQCVGHGLLKQGFAGDALNSAYYGRKVLPEAWNVEFFSAFGSDRVSQEMRQSIEALGIDTTRSAEVSDRQSGLYLIHLDQGERSFSYWRSNSAARLLGRYGDRLRSVLKGVDTVLFSGITLAILDDDGAERLLDELGLASQAGATVAFDPNIRAHLWSDKSRMISLMKRASEICTIALPSFDDEAAHFDDIDPRATADRFLARGARVVAVKNGSAGALVAVGAQKSVVPAHPVQTVRDTTGAGDCFNGVFLARLALGDEPDEAARHAARAAETTIQHFGAIPS